MILILTHYLDKIKKKQLFRRRNNLYYFANPGLAHRRAVGMGPAQTDHRFVRRVTFIGVLFIYCVGNTGC